MYLAKINAILFKAFALPTLEAYEHFAMDAMPGRNSSCLHGSIAKAGTIVWRTA